MAYDEKFRRQVINYKDEGHTFAEVREVFGVSSRSYYSWKAELEEKGKFENHYPKSRPGKVDPEKLKELEEKHPDWCLREFAAEFDVCIETIAERFKSLGITHKKNVRRSEKARKNRKST
ncbi:MAG: transposase [Spirochaetaceae bacterium]|jgi:transposase|nr:transposase [Spirochaetaceae bacterium]